MSETDITHMRHALVLGARGLGRVWPNPAVGCVIVKNHRIVGRGWTQDGGRPHAETMALAQASDGARGATAYVTLEPCSHDGDTPPCAGALIKAGVSRVVVAANDPDPRVNGRGLAMLEEAGIDVRTGVLEQEATVQHVGFMSKISHRRPMVTLKLAASLDGRIAMASGESQWITGAQSRRLVHTQRASHDAVMVGAGTARADDPTLMLRDIGIEQQPVRVILSRHLDLPLQGRLANSAKDAPLWILHGQGADRHLTEAWSGLGAKLYSVASGTDGRLNPASAMVALADAGLTRIYCEGGGALASSLMANDLVDRLVVFNAGIAIGSYGIGMVGQLRATRLADTKKFELLETHTSGVDTVSYWQRNNFTVARAG